MGRIQKLGPLQPLACFSSAGAAIVPSEVPARPYVSELVFLGSHTPVDDVDTRLAAWRAVQMPPQVELWQLLLHEPRQGPTARAIAPVARAARVATCCWNPAQIFRRLPLLSPFLENFSAYTTEEDEHLRRYH